MLLTGPHPRCFSGRRRGVKQNFKKHIKLFMLIFVTLLQVGETFKTGFKPLASPSDTALAIDEYCYTKITT